MESNTRSAIIGKFSTVLYTTAQALGIFGVILITQATSCVISSTPAFAEDAADNSIRMLHSSPDIRNVPIPASMMSLEVRVSNTKATDLKIRLVASRDGKLLDIALPSAVLDASDVPVYKAEIPAPLAYLSYQFVIQRPDGTFDTTKRFVLKRPCIQNFTVAKATQGADADFKNAVNQLVSQAKSYERDTSNYETSLKLLDKLCALLGDCDK